MNDPQNQYSPGLCNIGSREVRIRKKFEWIFFPLTILLTIACLLWCQSLLLWFALVFVSFSLIVLHLEIKYRFCILFGFFGLHNFEKPGNLHEVENPEHIRSDRKRVVQIVLFSLFLALSFSTAVHLIATCLLH